MLTVTKNGEITGDYWAGIRKVEQQRLRQAIGDKDRRQEEQYAAAMKSAIKPPKKKKGERKKPTLHDKYGERLYELYQEGLSVRRAAALLGINYSTALCSIDKSKGKRGRGA